MSELWKIPFDFTVKIKLYTLTILKLLQRLTRMVGLIAFVRPDSCVMGEKIYVRNTIITYQVFGIMTTPATVTMSMGLPADARAVKFFSAPFTKFILT